MKVYHGSQEVVEKPEIRRPNRTLDYGAGFYVTTSYEQAKNWVERKIKKGEVGYINVYELDENLMNTLSTLYFNEPTDEWVDFVERNRMDMKYEHNYDVVYGPVANDRVYFQFSLYETGNMSKQTLIAELKTYDLIDQYLFHTEKSLEALTFIQAQEIKL